MSDEVVQVKAELSGKQRRHLRGLGHGLRPVVNVGKEGISSQVLHSIEEAYHNHELIKLKIERSCPLDRKEAATELAAQSKSHLIQVLGRSVLLYRPDPESSSPLL